MSSRTRTDCSFVLQIRIQKWIQSSPAYFPATARIRGARVSRLCLFPRDTSRRDNGSFPFLGDDDGETIVVNGNPFGDVNAKFPIQPRSRALIIKSRVQLLQLQQSRRTSECADGESHAVRSFARRCLFPSIFFFRPLQGFVASHSSISLSRKPISWYLNYARFRARDWRGERDEERKRCAA